MPQQRPNFALDGDDTTGALRKLDNNCVDLDGRIAGALQAAANAQSSADGVGTLLNTVGWGTAQLPAISSIDGVNRSAVYRFIATTPGTLPTNQAYGTVTVLSYSSSDYTQLAQSVTGNEMAFRYYRGAGGGWGPWCRVWHTGNTTVDSNQFIKKAL
ncbi:hypothetical protein GCM10009552_16140 [Rothia nasimurium]|uniref:Tail fiber protein n=1 Tax=Luteibacter anthropi TaxID=564369 RepID=A0A7X5UBA7_9GAMM|nr:pyocin knob domain-containing protein [Luteibacter anthropi]NII07273.1 hypothetical protein [Luteibacter anthropi]